MGDDQLAVMSPTDVRDKNVKRLGDAGKDWRDAAHLLDFRSAGHLARNWERLFLESSLNEPKGVPAANHLEGGDM